MPNSTSVLLCDGKAVGFAFMNLTGGSIVNIPIVGIRQEHQGKGLSTIMLKHSMDYVLIRKHIMGTKLNSEQQKYADFNGDGKITTTDYVLIRKLIMGK